MIGKAKSNKSLVATINYNLKERAELVFSNQLVGEDINDYRLQMLTMQKCYTGTAKQLTLHVILSPHIGEGKNLTQEQWQTIANKYLEEMNLKDHQAIGFIHSDKEHRHLHLVINKVRSFNQKLYHDGFIGKRTQHAADRIAKDMKLIRAKEIMQQNNKKRNIQKQLSGDYLNNEITQPIITESLGSKQLFKKELLGILNLKKIKSVEDYFRAMKEASFKLLLYHNKETGELRGYGVEKNNTKMDASVISKQLTLTKLNAYFEEQKLIAAKEMSMADKEKQISKEIKITRSQTKYRGRSM